MGQLAERQPSSDKVLVRRDLIEFLRGAAPLDGLWFGEARAPDKGRYWWRKYLAAAEAEEKR